MANIYWLTESEFNHRPFVDALTHAGLEVEIGVETDPTKSLKKLNQTSVDGIILGMIFPKISGKPNQQYNGLHLVEDLRSNSSLQRETPLIIYSAADTLLIERELYNYKGINYTSDMTSPQDFVRLVQRAIK